MKIFIESLVLLMIIAGGAMFLLISVRMVFGKNLTFRFLSLMVPGLAALSMTVYFYGRLGGIYNIKISFILVPIAVMVLLSNFFLVGKFFIGKMQLLADKISQSADEASSAAQSISVISQNQAEGTSEQAAGIEETSSSIEEITSMIRNNAENANQANTLMAETTLVVDEANHTMGKLTDSMQEISSASEKTAKIVKTIDEIAFQTNLLALNAAVEAARAGEVGAGFAVVADEVRNLAMRAAEAAKNTANLIESTVTKIRHGSEIVSKTNEAFAKVASGSKKVGDLVGEISAASSEQAQGIEQINKAVSEMDKVVQKNAVNAEEAASASEEMSAQAVQLKSTIRDLVVLIQGSDKSMGEAENFKSPMKKVGRSSGFIGTTKQLSLLAPPKKRAASF